MKPETHKTASENRSAKQFPLVYIILVNWNGLADTIECLESLKKIDYDNYRVLVVDNASRGNDAEVLDQTYGKYINILRNSENLGFVGGNNRGIDYALKNQAEYILLLNNDTVVEPDFLTRLVGAMQRNKEIGISGSKIYHEHDRNLIWFAGGRNILYNHKYVHYGQDEIDVGLYNEEKEVYFITGCVLLIRSELLKKVGALDEDYFSYVEDNDLCCRVKRLGYTVYYIPKSVVYHKGNKSTRGVGLIHVYYRTRNRLLFIKKNLTIPIRNVFYLYWLGIFGGRSIRFLARAKYRPAVTMYYGIKDFAFGRYGKQWDSVEKILSLPTKNELKARLRNRLPVKLRYWLRKVSDTLYLPRNRRRKLEGKQALLAVRSLMKPLDPTTSVRIGVLSFGGIGDLLMANAFGRALRRKHPDARLTLFFDSDIGHELVDLYGVFNNFVPFGSQRNIRYLVKNLYPDFDMFYDTYRITRTYYGTTRFIRQKSGTDKLFAAYNLGNFYRYRPALANNLSLLDDHCILIMMKSAGLSGSLDDIRVALPENRRPMDSLSGKRYIVLSHGSNSRATTHSKQISTKNWDSEQWKEVVRYLHNKGFVAVQVGEEKNQAIDGAVSYLGKTDILTTSSIIRGATFYMGTEGGLSHLAAAMGTPSVILFGPTSIACFGYPDNVNIQNDRCTNCWWSKPDWFNRCPKGYASPLCMELISVEEVINGTNLILTKIRS